MSETRKNHLNIDGGQVKEDEHVASYKPIPESDTGFRSSKNNLTKSKEKISPDGAEEKLLPKDVEAKIVTRVDMADAKYVVEDHRNGDANIELDANKKQFSGLSKEELMKYADDPFWVNLRWFMFILFWAMWVCMLAAAITIIVKAPKCATREPRTWFEKGPLVDIDEAPYMDVAPELEQMQSSLVKGIFVDVPTYPTESEATTVYESFKNFALNAKKYGVKVIVDLIPNYVAIDHEWFLKSVNKEAQYADYFIWANVTKYSADNHDPEPPNNWISKMDTPAWTLNKARNEFYLHQFDANQPDLNFNNRAVALELENSIRKWMKAGAAGVRLNKARLMLVDKSLSDESIATGRGSTPGAAHTQYTYLRHSNTRDLSELDQLFGNLAAAVKNSTDAPGDAVFTLQEEDRPELFLMNRASSLSPAMAAPIFVTDNVTQLANDINVCLNDTKWTALQLKRTTADEAEEIELALLALLLPAAPVLDRRQVRADPNDTRGENLSHLVSLREDASVEHGNFTIVAVPSYNSTEDALIACARWKVGHTGYMAVYNPLELPARADVSSLRSVPELLTVHHVTHQVKLYTNYTTATTLHANDVLVPPKSTVVLSYVPKTAKD